MGAAPPTWRPWHFANHDNFDRDCAIATWSAFDAVDIKGNVAEIEATITGRCSRSYWAWTSTGSSDSGRPIGLGISSAVARTLPHSLTSNSSTRALSLPKSRQRPTRHPETSATASPSHWHPHLDRRARADQRLGRSADHRRSSSPPPWMLKAKIFNLKSEI